MRAVPNLACHISVGLALTSSQNSFVPMEYFCTRIGHSIVKKDDAIYVYGGVRDKKIFNGTYLYDSQLIKLDLSYSWNILNDDQPTTFISSPNSTIGPPSSLVDSSIFDDANGNFHIYGGGLAIPNAPVDLPINSSPIQNKVWTLSNNSDSWESSNIEMPRMTYAPMHALYAQAPKHNLVFLLNGILSDGTSELVYPEMTIINTETNDIRTVSTENLARSTARVGATLQYLPLLGRRGATRHQNNVTTDQWGTMVSLDTIHIFDIASLNNTANGLWYQQRTSGRTPKSRISTCTVPILSPDNTSYHIYIYSGRSPSEIHHDIWVLSLPLFHWAQVFQGSRPNYGSACSLAGKKQILIFGGNKNTPVCDKLPYVALFDMTNLKWFRSFVKEDFEFRVPKTVYERIGGSAMGKSNMREPEGGFSSPGLASMFDEMSVSEKDSSGFSRKGKRAYVRATVVALWVIGWLWLL